MDIGLIAGSGRFPLLFARAARRAGHRVIAVAHHDETDAAIEQEADVVTWVHVGQLGKIIRAFRDQGVTEAAMAGGIRKVRVFGGLRPDMAVLKRLPSLASRNDDSLLRTVAGWFEEEGIRIVECTRFCGELLARPGLHTRRDLDDRERRDVEVGLATARALGAVDVGQTVCVKESSVVAVEAVEGTDRTLRRAGELAGKGVVVVKVAKPQQDMRFDVPTVGPGTIEVLVEIRASALAIEAGRTLVLDETELVRRADRAGIAVVAV
jgi:DUF1009 family protein